jgi:hypothetical protein
MNCRAQAANSYDLVCLTWVSEKWRLTINLLPVYRKSDDIKIHKASNLGGTRGTLFSDKLKKLSGKSGGFGSHAHIIPASGYLSLAMDNPMYMMFLYQKSSELPYDNSTIGELENHHQKLIKIIGKS